MLAPHRHPITLSLSPLHPSRCHRAPPHPGPAHQPRSPASPMAAALPCSCGNGAAHTRWSGAIAGYSALPTVTPIPHSPPSPSSMRTRPQGPLLLFLLPRITEPPSKQMLAAAPCPFSTPLSSHPRPSTSPPPLCSLDPAYPPRTVEPVSPLLFSPIRCRHSPSR
jgi:hypothetical protein